MRHTREVDEYNKVLHGLVFDDPIELMEMVCEAGDAGKFTRYMGNPFNWKNRKGNDRDPLQWLGRSDLKGWTGDGSLRAAISDVWPPGEDRVKKLLAQLEQHPFIPPRDLRRRSVWRDDGDGDFDLDRFVDGREAWRGPKRREVVGRQFLTFIVDVSANCHVAAEAMYWRAAVAIACAQTLEEFGYGVEVVACANLINVLHPPGRPMNECDADDNGGWDGWYDPFGHGDRGNGRRLRVTPGVYQDIAAAVWVKRPDDAVDLGMLTAVCSPWFFRLGFFGMYGLVPGQTPRYCLGTCVDLDAGRLNDLIGANEVDRERVILAGVWNEGAAAALMRATLRRFADPEWLADHPDAKPEHERKRGSL